MLLRLAEVVEGEEGPAGLPDVLIGPHGAVDVLHQLLGALGIEDLRTSGVTGGWELGDGGGE